MVRFSTGYYSLPFAHWQLDEKPIWQSSGLLVENFLDLLNTHKSYSRDIEKNYTIYVRDAKNRLKLLTERFINEQRTKTQYEESDSYIKKKSDFIRKSIEKTKKNLQQEKSEESSVSSFSTDTDLSSIMSSSYSFSLDPYSTDRILSDSSMSNVSIPESVLFSNEISENLSINSNDDSSSNSNDDSSSNSKKELNETQVNKDSWEYLLFHDKKIIKPANVNYIKEEYITSFESGISILPNKNSIYSDISNTRIKNMLGLWKQYLYKYASLTDENISPTQNSNQEIKNNFISKNKLAILKSIKEYISKLEKTRNKVSVKDQNRTIHTEYIDLYLKKFLNDNPFRFRKLSNLYSSRSALLNTINKKIHQTNISDITNLESSKVKIPIKSDICQNSVRNEVNQNLKKTKILSSNFDNKINLYKSYKLVENPLNRDLSIFKIGPNRLLSSKFKKLKELLNLSLPSINNLVKPDDELNQLNKMIKEIERKHKKEELNIPESNDPNEKNLNNDSKDINKDHTKVETHNPKKTKGKKQKKLPKKKNQEKLKEYVYLAWPAINLINLKGASSFPNRMKILRLSRLESETLSNNENLFLQYKDDSRILFDSINKTNQQIKILLFQLVELNVLHQSQKII